MHRIIPEPHTEPAPHALHYTSSMYGATGSVSRRMATGVLNVVSGDAAAIGETLTASPVVRKIGFTGSTRVGKLLLRQSAETVKRVSMELGGNAPFVVFADADVAAAADALVASGLRNAGQTCVCANRVLVHVRRSARPASARHMRGTCVAHAWCAPAE